MTPYDFQEYLKATEPSVREKAYAWKTAIGLQQVDGLAPSDYLVSTARKNIEGEITLTESRRLIETYYKSYPPKDEDEKGKQEADLVSQHIAEVIAATLEYEFERERKFDYRNLSPRETVAHLVRFVSDVWQIHAFGEGNTRATSIFTIKYLKKLGFDVTNDVFADNARYFRNALVRANYTNLPRGVHPTTVFLNRFFANLLLGEKNDLKSRYLHITLPSPKVDPQEREQVREQVGEQARADEIARLQARPSRQVQRLLKVMKGEMSVVEMMAALKLGGRRNFLEKYLTPAIDAGLIEKTQPNAPHSPTQRYRQK